MNKLIDKLISGNGKLSLLLLDAKERAEEAQDEKLIKFINNELNGYSGDSLPDYRKIKGEVIATVKDSYGSVVQQNEPIDFSILTNQLGFDISVTPISDGIGFIEDNLDELSGLVLERPLHREIVKMLSETFQHNNPLYHISSASHQFGRAGIQFILTKVRQELVIGLRRLRNQSKEKETFNRVTALGESSDQIAVFVTYAWDGEDHNDKVISFVEFLRNRGFNASMDRKESQEQSAIDFNEMMINGIQNSEKVIIILSKKYKEKADSFEGGVGFEFKIILEQLKTNANKFIFAYFGDTKHAEVAPTAIGARDVLNLKKDQDETDFNQLVAKLESKNILNFSEVNETKPKVKTKKIKPFKL